MAKKDNNTGYTKSYYKIREVAEMFHVPVTTLRFWEKEFPELEPRRSAHNQRTYRPEDIELLSIINYLVKTKGYKIDAAKELIRKNRKNISRKIEIIQKLEGLKSDLELLMKCLSIREQKLNFKE